MSRPSWWNWDLEFSPHLLKRMLDRQFNEADLRVMLEIGCDCHADIEPGRWAIPTQHDGRRWEVIVEPVEAERILLVVTAYPVE